MLVEHQIAERRGRAQDAVAKVLARPRPGPFGDYSIQSRSGKTYKVAMRGTGLFENYCSCPDFAVNTLGTCKHIEAMLERLRARRGKTLASAAYKRTRASVSLHYGETLEVVLRLSDAPSDEIRAVAETWFDKAGRLPREHYSLFGKVLDALRSADDHAVIYSDVLEFIDRENEIAEGLEWERELLSQLERGGDPLPGLLETRLLPYQSRGALFAASRGRVVLADNMGLGKTVQALAATELLRRRPGSSGC